MVSRGSLIESGPLTVPIVACFPHAPRTIIEPMNNPLVDLDPGRRCTFQSITTPFPYAFRLFNQERPDIY